MAAREASARHNAPKTDTVDETKQLLEAGKSVREIARLRELTETTIWNHIEKLAEQGGLTLDAVVLLTKTFPDWEAAWPQLVPIMDEVGTEKLKPIYEGANEAYDYDLIRLARLRYQIEQANQSDEAL